MFHSKTYIGGINKCAVITSFNNPRSFKRGVISILSIQHWVFRCFIDFYPACFPALTLRGLLSARDNMLELSEVSTQSHFSLILMSLPLTFSDSMHQSICISHSSQVFVLVLLPLFTLLTLLLSWLSLLTVRSILSSTVSVIHLLRQEQCPRLPWPEYTLIRHSLCCSTQQQQQQQCPPFPSSHSVCASCFCLQGSWVCHWHTLKWWPQRLQSDVW